MIRIQQLKLSITHTKEQLLHKIAKTLRVKPQEIIEWQIRRKSVDARKKQEVSYVYTIDVKVRREEAVLARARGKQISRAEDARYQFPETYGTRALEHAPVVIGSGPAGLFCAYLLAEHGFCPVIIERGKSVQERTREVEQFWRENRLNPQSNVQFGEGGAGTFSDGKLNTLIKDVKGRNRKILEIFIRHGAPESIAYDSKPHIGTDILKEVITDMRRQIERWGGAYLFEHCVTDLEFSQNRLKTVVLRNQITREVTARAAELAVLAVGHSARDTFDMLLTRGFEMEAKSFAVGLRVEHPQSMISEIQYGREAAEMLPPASYKVTANLENGRGVYSFCMCPGGYVVNASSEEGRLAVNGMSYQARDSRNANSAVIVTVTPEDFPGEGPLAGVEFQRRLEEQAYVLGKGNVPQQLFADFERGKISASYGRFPSEIKGLHAFGALHELFPGEIRDSFCQGMHQFAKYIPEFDRWDAILSGVESRTSSPVRITRGESLESNKKGVYPCGEGAGYAGGIMSAAMDGMKTAEAIASAWKPPEKAMETAHTSMYFRNQNPAQRDSESTDKRNS